MSSTFLGLNIGASALSAFQTSVNTTANNIANSKTTGYSRQTATLATTAALRVSTRYGSVGTGVEVTSVGQERDEFYDSRYWNNNSSLGLYETKVYYLDQIENYFTDSEQQTGFSTLFNSMFNSLDKLISEGASDESVRNQFINNAQNLCSYFNSLSSSLSELQSDVNEEIKSSVMNINAISKKVSLLNEEINAIEIRGGKANELRDERANLIDELSKVTAVETKEVEIVNTYGENLGGTNFTLSINGQVLVDGYDYRTLECVSQDYKNNQNDIDGLYSIVWSDTGMDFASTTETAGGSLKALFQIRDGNNAECVKGTVTDAQASTDTKNGTITIKPSSPQDITSLSIAAKGQFTINNKTYNYDGWDAEVDADGKITSFTFQLSDEFSEETAKNVQDKYTTIGESVEGMGIPYYLEQINEFLRTFTQMFNDMEQSGVTLTGEQMGTFFVANNLVDGSEFDMSDWNQELADGQTSYTISSSDSTYYQMTGKTVAVNAQSLRDPRYFSTAESIVDGVDAYDIVDKLKTLQKDVEIFRGDSAASFLETLLSDVAVDSSESQIFEKTYSSLEQSIGNLRTSVSGVDEDEEALNLIKFQNAYNMASKVISVMSEMYNKLINETGVT
jgi:flagellar hook-associated protein 1 FlgK